MAMQSSDYRLVYLDSSNPDPNEQAMVTISSSEIVGGLLERIRNTDSRYKNASALQLKLYQVDIPYGVNMHQEITGRLNALPSPLWPNRLLTGLYPSKPAAETLHMILVDSGPHKGAINIVPSPQQSISNISPSTSFSTVQRQIEDFLDKLRPRIKTFLEAPNLPSWAPPTTVNGEVHEFYQELKVPAVNGKPRLLLHNLGSNNETADTIFGMSKVVLCNTSGSGKTRALLDGLSTRWGFYLTADPGVDDIGSKDLMEIITGMPNKLEWVNDVFNGASDPKDIQARSRTNERLAMLGFLAC
ncbi:SubName: Full=Uncharacterized protein {ECO:0000313/EMBL:CCA69086.1} [Serendipita indica DSM 11827]|nr:SubName: Full=Uncharacterized protein {ECO:0000313/EMBL:CCA69086.1} [Serendipita indica DSM 11827]